MKAVAKWLHENIQKNSIKFGMNKTGRVKSQNEKIDVKTSSRIDQKLPPVKRDMNEKLQEELKFLIEIFEEMER